MPALALFVLAALAGPSQQVKPTIGLKPPKHAVVLFDGKDSSQWVHKNGSAAKWPVENGAIVCNTGTGDIFSKQKIGSAQIHVEFAIPYMPQQHDQARGNSGVYLQGRYEIQVLDSFPLLKSKGAPVFMLDPHQRIPQSLPIRLSMADYDEFYA